MLDPVLIKIGGRMRALRLGRHLTQAQVAEAAAIETSFYGQIERGRNTPSVKTLLAVAKALGVAPGELLPEPARPLGQRYASVIEGMLTELPEKDLGLILGVVSDLVVRLKK